MKQEQIIDALNLLPEDILEETGKLRSQKEKSAQANAIGQTAHSTSDRAHNIRSFPMKWTTIAACIGFLLCGGLLLFTVTRLIPAPSEETPAELAMLTIAEQPYGEGGFSAFQAYDISEWVNNNPWNENAQLTTLPVYRNQLTYDEQYQVQGTDFDKMETLLLDVIDGLGMDTDDFDISDNAPSAYLQSVITEKLGGDVPEGYFNPTEMRAKNDDIQIEISADLTAEIWFEPAVTLPDKYHFTHHASYEDTEAVAGYLKKKYNDLLSFRKPQINIHGGGYNNVLEQSYNIEFFEGKGTLTEQIINYNFNRVAFYCNDEGQLDMVRVYRPNLSEKMGNYPIISVEQATEYLITGQYYSNVPYEVAGADYIAKVELVYRTGQYEEYFMPYYFFYVEIPELEREGNLKTYGLYYVPAVEEKYISNKPEYYPYE